MMSVKSPVAAETRVTLGPTGYPSPRYPEYMRRPSSPADLLTAAREALTSERPLGKVRPDARVLIVTPADQDPLVLEAMLEAFRERSVEVTVKTEHEIGISPPPEELDRLSIADGWKEILWKQSIADMLPPGIAAQRPRNITNHQALRPYLADNPQFDTVFAGQGAPNLWRQRLREQGHRYADAWEPVTREELVAEVFPDDLWRLVESKILGLVSAIQEVRITDAQGTHIQFSVNEEEAALWSSGAPAHAVLHLSPVSATRSRVQYGIVRPEEEERVFPKFNGVIAGTTGHVGYFPHLICHVEDGVITRIEGGGLYGDLLRELLARTKHLQYPRFPRPGFFYVDEASLGTNPRVFRHRAGMFDTTRWFVNGHQTWRSGNIKWGFGAHSWHPDVRAFAEKHGLPPDHFWHLYNLFVTYQVRLRSGESLTLIDKGHLTALDDPEVRTFAERYGDPDAVLREDWFPAIPGINYPGDYMRDFGRDPVEWIRKENEDRLPATIGVPQPG
jgi:hypothetical protein